jgi:hypothetical protein
LCSVLGDAFTKPTLLLIISFSSIQSTMYMLIINLHKNVFFISQKGIFFIYEIQCLFSYFFSFSSDSWIGMDAPWMPANMWGTEIKIDYFCWTATFKLTQDIVLDGMCLLFLHLYMCKYVSYLQTISTLLFWVPSPKWCTSVEGQLLNYIRTIRQR